MSAAQGAWPEGLGCNPATPEAPVDNHDRHSAGMRHIVFATAGSLTVGAPTLMAPRFQA